MRRRRLRAFAVGSFVVFGIVAGAVRWASDRALERVYSPGPSDVVAASRAGVSSERGRHLVTAVAQCTFCHGNDLGGREIADDPLLGRIDSANLTSGEGGLVGRYGRDDWVRALRHGVRPDGRSLVLMPAIGLSKIADDDLQAVVDYLEQVPPIDRSPRPTRFGWMTRAVVALGLADDIFSAEEANAHRPAVPRADVLEAATPDYGAYLVALGNCRVCHKSDLRGGLHPLALPEEPPPPPLVGEGALEGWTRADFARAMREGRTPEGQVLDREYMPWPGYAALTDLEIEALWAYLAPRASPAPARLTASR